MTAHSGGATFRCQAVKETAAKASESGSGRYKEKTARALIRETAYTHTSVCINLSEP
jgi:hypothetical protein